MQPPKITSIFLERSGDLPLDIYTISDPCYGPDHLRRIKTLRLRESGPDGLSETFSRLSIPSPVITEVIIEVTGPAFADFPNLPLLFGDLSTIRSLSLDNLSFDTKLLLFTSLSSLSLDIPGDLLPPFFDFLNANPTLEFISISVWGAIPTESVGGPPIVLDNLINLHCRDVSRHLLSRLSLPHCAFIQIEDTGPPLALSQSLPTSTANLRCFAQIDSLNLTTTTGVTYSGQATDTHKVEFMGPGGLAVIHWIVGYDGPREFYPGPLSLTHAKELTVTHETVLDRPRASELDLSLLFDAMRNLEVLKLHSCPQTDCHYILPPCADNHVCPSLHTVEVVHCSGLDQWLSSLLHIAVLRRNFGFPLRRIDVHPHPNVDSPIRNYIREINEVLSDSPATDTVQCER